MKLKLFWKNYISEIINDQEANKVLNASLVDAGLIVKNRIKELGINRFSLSNRTLISPYVLEAIENGWINKLPEKAYLNSMLIILEKELDLPENSLVKFIQKESQEKRRKEKSLIASIDLFSTWKGNLIYLIMMSLSLFTLNHINRKFLIVEGIGLLDSNQSKLDKQNQVTKSERIRLPHLKENNQSKKLFPPLKDFLWKKPAKWIELQITSPVSLTITSNKNKKVELGKIKGKVRFKIQPPIIVQTEPPLTINDQIDWEGNSYIPEKNNNGVYKF